MKAATYYKYGGPEVVRVEEVQRPLAKDDEILVRIHFSTVNRTDTGFRSAEYVVSRLFSGLINPKLSILGNEFAGEIVAIGKNVRSYKTGDRVFGYNDSTFGCHAEYVVMKENAALTFIPENLDYEQAAALTEGAHYALCDIRAAKVTAGQKVLVNGGTGAIGSAAIQLLKYFGAEVTAVCASQHVDLVRSLGAEVAIDYTKEDFTRLNKEFDFVFDAVGKSTYGKCRKILKKKGIYISTELGPGGQNIFLALLTPLIGGKKLLFPIPAIAKEDILFLAKLAAENKLRALKDRTYKLEDIVEAHRYAGSGQKVGNVLLKIG